MLGISKRGDKYLRTLLIHGARTALTHGKAPVAWQHGEAQADERRCRCLGEQDGAHDMGPVGS